MLLNAVVTTGSTGTDAILVESVKDSTGQSLTLSDPISITVSKAPTVVRYSLVYMTDVNARPQEVIAQTSLISCASGSSSLLKHPTCGALYYQGKLVRGSEGYCCTCSLDQMIGLSPSQRGNANCNILSGISSNGGSVHCLRWGALWYSVFSILTPSIDSTVIVSGSGGLSLTLDSEHPSLSQVVSGTLNVSARLIGSFQWSRPPADWGQSSLVVCPNIPGSPNADSGDIRIGGFDPNNPFRFGMLIRQTAFDLTGETCNKIGVSHTAFVQGQANKCSGQVGDCLRNQIEDLWKSSAANDLVPEKLCASIGGAFVEDDGYRLSCELKDSASDIPTQILIRMNAENVLLVTNESYGVILNVSTTQEIIALVQKTTITVLIENTGDLTSQFGINIQNCSSGSLTLPLSSSVISILPHAISEVSIKIEDSQISGGNYTCNAVLTDTDGNQLSSFPFLLSVTATSTDRGSQESVGTSGESSSPASGDASQSGCDQCHGFFSIVCFVSNSCWSGIGSLLGVFGGVGLLFAFFTKFGGWSLVWSLCKGLCGCCCNSANRPKRRNSDVAEPEVRYLYPQFGAYPQPRSWFEYPAGDHANDKNRQYLNLWTPSRKT